MGETSGQDPRTTAADTTEAGPDDESLVAESLIEEVSIDGMCGVY